MKWDTLPASRIPIVLLAVVAMALLINLTRHVSHSAFASPKVSVTPYTAKLILTVSRPDGTLDDTRRASLTVAVRGDGSRAIIDQSTTAAGTEYVRNIHFATGERIEVGDLADVKTTWRPTQVPNTNSWYRDPASKCLTTLSGQRLRRTAGEVLESEEVVDGLRAVRIRSGRTNLEWFAIDHGCALIRARYDFGSSISEQRLLSLTPGEPDPAIFHVSRGLIEVSPSGFVSKINPICGEKCIESQKANDQRYHAQR